MSAGFLNSDAPRFHFERQAQEKNKERRPQNRSSNSNRVQENDSECRTSQSERQFLPFFVGSALLMASNRFNQCIFFCLYQRA